MRVLIVEDHRDILEVLARLMRRWGFEVIMADTLETAIDRLATPFDAIVCDIGLPDGTGYAVVNEAKRMNKNMFAIALSGYSSPMEVKMARMAGFDHFLTKPFDSEKIRTLLATVAHQSPQTAAID
jgi:DNA-binding response OmpR family regulator